MAIGATTMTYLKRVIEEFLPFFVYIRRSAKKKRLEEILPADDATLLGYGRLNVDDLRKRLEERHKDAAFLDEKTFKMTLALALALTFLGTSVTALVKEIGSPVGKLAVASLVSASILYILFGGIIALGAMKSQKTYGKATTAGTETPGELAEALRKQELSNVRRHLRNEASFQSLRNGLCLLIVAIVVFVFFYIRGLLNNG
jgi:hypothetical protein